MITESQLEEQCLAWFREIGWQVAFGPDLAHDGSAPERTSYREVVLTERLKQTLVRLNPGVPAAALGEAVRHVTRLDSPVAMQRNREFHRMLVDGIRINWREGDKLLYEDLRLIDFADPDNNDFLVVNQFAVKGPDKTRRPDIVVFVNGLPLAVIELKNPADEQTDIWAAWQQLQTYRLEIPDLFNYNEALIISDGLMARVGSLPAAQERFMPWRTVNNEADKRQLEFEAETLIRGFFKQNLLLDYLQNFIIFEQASEGLTKKIAAYHQFHAVREAVMVTLIAARDVVTYPSLEPRVTYGREVLPGSRKAGVVWHTQGSGKSLSMVCYAGKLIQQPEMKNPTIVVVTDRNDLDGQLYETFCAAEELLRQTPEQAESREELREMLATRQAGGIIFTTIHKFASLQPRASELPYPSPPFPESEENSAGADDVAAINNRSNIVVISDEAHRSHYGLKARLDTSTGRYVYGFAKYLRDSLPNASFIGFTGTPIEQDDRDTRAIFGDYISIYDIQDAVDDGATVEIFYESRLAKLDINKGEIEQLNTAVEEVIEGEEEEQREKTKGVWTALEKLVGAKERVREVAADLVKHFEARISVIEGKAMIVGMSREICARLYDAIVAIRPEWHSADINKGAIKVVMTGSAADIELLQPHVTSRHEKKIIERRFKNPDDPLQLVIVRDMWLTGFDVPCCHTMYIDKPMRGHTLMQAIARVNRVFKNKPGGLVVDYIGIANDLKAALQSYTDSKGRGQPSRDVEEFLEVLLEKMDVCRGLFHRFDYSGYTVNPLGLLAPAANHILGLTDGKKRFLDLITAITRAFALCGTLDEAEDLREEIAFFCAVRGVIIKHTTVDKKLTEAEKHSVLRQILDNAIVSEGVDDIFTLAGLGKPNISLLSDDFMEEVRSMPHKNLAVELLEKLLRDEIKAHTRTNVVLQKKFGDRLLESLRKYHNRSIETAQVIEELIKMAGDFRDALNRNTELGLNADEIAFYDALAERPEVLREMGDVTLKQLAVELTQRLRQSTTVDWQVRATVRARIRIIIKRLLRKYKYPPAGQDAAVARVLEQAEALADEWSR